jgi:hypothetical protein
MARLQQANSELLNDATDEGSIAIRLFCRHSSQLAVLAQQSNQI